MPSGNLPAAGYLGNGQRTTGEFQGGIDELLDYVRSLKAEVDALSATVIKEAAVRGVGNGAGLVPDKAVLDTRLGTGGNLPTLGDMATQSSSDYAKKNASGAVVFSGTSNSVTQDDMGNPGAGLYLVKYSTSTGNTTASIYWDGASSTQVVGTLIKQSTLDWSAYRIAVGSTGIIGGTRVYWYGTNGNFTLQELGVSILEIKKI